MWFWPRPTPRPTPHFSPERESKSGAESAPAPQKRQPIRTVLALLSPALVAMTLGGCQTAAEVQQAQQAQMESVVGLTMADFSARTGLTPSDAYAVAGGRVSLCSDGP